LKNKKNIKILLPIVIVIWGLVIYTIIDAFSSEDMAVLKNVTSVFKAPKINKKETFTMLPVQSDPFLGTLYRKANNTKTTKRRVAQKIKWPTIKYEGIISGRGKKLAVYIISINGEQHLLKKGDTIQHLKVIKGSQESLRLKFKGQTKEFPIM